MVFRYWENEIACSTVIIYNTAENVWLQLYNFNLAGKVMFERKLV